MHKFCVPYFSSIDPVFGPLLTPGSVVFEMVFSELLDNLAWKQHANKNAKLQKSLRNGMLVHNAHSALFVFWAFFVNWHPDRYQHLVFHISTFWFSMNNENHDNTYNHWSKARDPARFVSACAWYWQGGACIWSCHAKRLPAPMPHKRSEIVSNRPFPISFPFFD